MSSDQPVMVRLRRNTTSTPWGFRMQGGNEYGAVLFIQKVNPKSVASRQGLREGDRLLYVNGAPAHQMNHEQAKMEIIRGGNELDILVQRNAVPIAHKDRVDSRSQMVEESTDYRGYTNPNVQSRSFKIIQQSLSVEEAEEGK